MPSSSPRQAHKAPALRFTTRPCSLGFVLVAASELGLAAVYLGDDKDELARTLQADFPSATRADDDASLAGLAATIVALVENPSENNAVNLPLDIHGTPFQQRVWQALREIPPGATVTYSDIAARIGSPKAVRAVASACGANPLSIVIPCHRVVGKNGSLSGYHWGIERKRALLDKEKAK